MTERERKEALFHEIAMEHIHGVRPDITIEEMLELYDSLGFWSEEEERGFVVAQKKDQLRRYARKPFRTEDGELHLIVNIVRGPKAPEGRQQVFAFLSDTTMEDLEWLVEYHIRRAHQASDKVEFIITEYRRRYGKKATRQLRLNLNWPEPAPAGV
jgi:hypothetical protein